jgi:asparagine N-glycosylation enzyme membrane subunit Stt3
MEKKIYIEKNHCKVPQSDGRLSSLSQILGATKRKKLYLVFLGVGPIAKLKTYSIFWHLFALILIKFAIYILLQGKHNFCNNARRHSVDPCSPVTFYSTAKTILNILPLQPSGHSPHRKVRHVFIYTAILSHSAAIWRHFRRLSAHPTVLRATQGAKAV